MPLIRVVSRLGKPLAAPIQASFGAVGGTLGRSPDCTLALPDEGRHISRQQARIDVAQGATSITCLGTANPLIVNGQELRQGQTRRLAHGDRIHIAEYELRFEAGDGMPSALPTAGSMPVDPFADPFSDPFADPPASLPSEPHEHFENRRDSSMAPIPEEFEPFGDATAPPPSVFAQDERSRRSDARDPLGLGLAVDPMTELTASKAESIDALFDLKAGQDPLGPDSPLGRPAGERAHGAGTGAPGLANFPVADNAFVLSGSFRLPQAIPPTEFGVPDDPVLSWKRDSDPAQDAILPPAPSADAAEISAIANQAVDAHRAGPEPHRGTQPTDALAPVARGSGPAADLLQALVLGLGVAELPREAGPAGAPAQTLTPELMRRLGELLAAASDGTVQLLQARATLKQELRADVTRIGARDNNPLKFVPDGQAALNQLLAPQPIRGFMAPQRAMRDAYDDLLAHQIGFVAGMRAAMQGLIGRFDPQVLEGRLASKSVLDAMLPAARKARLWELFNSLFAEVSREAEDDFERLFGRAFVKAYEEQIARIEASAKQLPGDANPSRHC